MIVGGVGDETGFRVMLLYKRPDQWREIAACLDQDFAAIRGGKLGKADGVQFERIIVPLDRNRFSGYMLFRKQLLPYKPGSLNSVAAGFGGAIEKRKPVGDDLPSGSFP